MSTDRIVSRDSLYSVIINHEEQYSIWPEDRNTPLGWKMVGHTATRDQALNAVVRHWVNDPPRDPRQAALDHLERNLAAQTKS